MKLKISELIKQETENIRTLYNERVQHINTDFFEQMVKRFITANKKRFDDIDDDAMVQIKKKLRIMMTGKSLCHSAAEKTQL